MTSRSVPVQLDRLRHLTFTFNAIADLQDVDPRIWLKDIAQPPVLRRYLWAGLKHEDRTLTEIKVGELIEQFMEGGGDLLNLVMAVDDAIGGSVYHQQLKKGEDRAAPSVPDEGISSKNSEGSGSKQ